MLLFIGSSLMANDEKTLSEEKCIKLLGMGMYNQILESICGFDGKVSLLADSIYTKGKCRITIKQEQVDKLSKEVVKDTISRSEEMGIDNFCKGNKQAYYDLAP